MKEDDPGVWRWRKANDGCEDNRIDGGAIRIGRWAVAKDGGGVFLSVDAVVVGVGKSLVERGKDDERCCKDAAKGEGRVGLTLDTRHCLLLFVGPPTGEHYSPPPPRGGRFL